MIIRLFQYFSSYENDLLKVKVKVHPLQTLRLCTGRTAHRGNTGTALPFHNHGTRRCQRHVSAALYPRERLGTLCTGGLVGPRVHLDRCGKSCAPTGIRSPDRPALSHSLTDKATRHTHLLKEVSNKNLHWILLWMAVPTIRGFLSVIIICAKLSAFYRWKYVHFGNFVWFTPFVRLLGSLIGDWMYTMGQSDN